MHPGRERALAQLATRQHGVVAYRQLLGLGFGPGAIERRTLSGRLHRLHRGVYGVGRTRVEIEGRWLAAVLACGDGAILSRRSAAALWGLRQSETIEVTVAGRIRPRHPGIVAHTSRDLPDEDRAFRHAIPVTTVARTVLDLAGVVQRSDLERTIEEAERLRLLDLSDLQRLLDRGSRRRGTNLLRQILAEELPGTAATRSHLERRFLMLSERAGLPPPQVNVGVAGLEVDCLWSRQRLVVELDGHTFHRTRAAFERDRARDAVLQLAGFRVLRITHRRLDHEPAAVLDAVRRLLEASPSP